MTDTSGPNGTDSDPIEVRDLRADEIPQAVAVIARGMRDNPLHVAAYGPDPDRRLRCHGRLVGGMFGVSPAMRHICAIRNGAVVGLTGVAPVDTCRLSTGQKVRLLPALAALGPSAVAKVLSWTGTWSKHDPNEPHVHLGPLAVDAALQGRGIGSRIMREHCRRLDAAGESGYLETDKAANVAFYERFGYTVTAEAEVIGVPNWFMRRAART
ncbi:acetyltransferase (GNAT) family protein [Murinocardiopsis flavida]|uniref:Acetyltransferase (GNAT) family protein n=1 Tax=Murinocardiopsis flavida TaxID=645275 RepID=A0A2P8DE34_9ACTN|nr:GNAT family N-acetyltransferase [Murinocardiopsis flavida]PSK95465.1 acetyltransferase (GNAT) family protein [Murinocardiopsis flavida]